MSPPGLGCGAARRTTGSALKLWTLRSIRCPRRRTGFIFEAGSDPKAPPEAPKLPQSDPQSFPGRQTSIKGAPQIVQNLHPVAENMNKELNHTLVVLVFAAAVVCAAVYFRCPEARTLSAQPINNTANLPQRKRTPPTNPRF